MTTKEVPGATILIFINKKIQLLYLVASSSVMREMAPSLSLMAVLDQHFGMKGW